MVFYFEIISMHDSGIRLQRHFDNLVRVSSFLTIPNAFRQRAVTLPIIHSAITRLLSEKLPDGSYI